MTAPTNQVRRAKRFLLASVTGSALVIATLAALPKDATYASPQRLAMTLLMLMALLIGGAGCLASWRRYRDALMRARYGKAPSAMRHTLQFLLQERQLSRRKRLALMAAAWSAFSLFVLSHWPQLSTLAPLRASFDVLSVACLMLLAAQPFYVRRSLVNAFFLSRYLRQQAAHIGFSPKAANQLNGTDKPPVVPTGFDRFRAGGFEWRFADFKPNIVVMGQPGSGKTITVLNPFLEGLIGCSMDGLKAGGLILDPKGAYRETIRPLCERVGRGDDLYILSPDSWETAARTPDSIAWNPLDTKDDAVEVASRMIVTMKLAGGLKAHDSFFLDAARVFMRHAIVLTRAAAAPEPTTLQAIHRLCAEPISDPVEYDGLIGMLAAEYPEVLPPEVQTAFDYIEQEWRTLPDRHLSGVRSAVTQLIDDFTTSPVVEIVSGPSTISVGEIIEGGKLLYVHLPLAGRERVARILSNLVRLEFQRQVLRRVGKARPSFLFADEFQALFVSGEDHGDSDFFEKSRESNHGNCVAAQNVSSFTKRTANRADVMNFLGLCATKIFLRNTERETNEWASNLFGERSEIIVSASEAARLDGGFSRNQTSYSRSAKSVRVVPPEAFAALAVPVAENPAAWFAESIVQFGTRDAIAKLELNWRVHPLRP